MDTELRKPLVSLVIGLLVLIVLSAQTLALIPFVTGIVLLINKQLIFSEWLRDELEGTTILRIVNRWLDFEVDQIMIGSFVLTGALVVFPVIAGMPGLRLDQQLAYAWVFYGISVIQLSVIVLMPIGHIALRLKRTSKMTLVIWVGVLNALAFVATILVQAPALLIVASALTIGLSVFTYSMLIGPQEVRPRVPAIDDFYLLVFAWVVLYAIATMFGNPVETDGIVYVFAVSLSVVEGVAALAFGFVGLLTIFEMSGQEKKEGV